MHGKKKCKILKEIRKQIAKDNDITYVTTSASTKATARAPAPSVSRRSDSWRPPSPSGRRWVRV